MGLALAFWTGSLVGFFVSREIRGLALVANAVFFFLIGVSLIVYFIHAHHVGVCEALLGMGKFGSKFKRIAVTNENDDPVSESQLLELFDELDQDHTGAVDQDDIVLAIAKNHARMSVSRRKFSNIMTDLFSRQHVDPESGDWKLSREDWLRLVHRSERRGNMSDDLGRQISASGPESIRRCSIQMMERAGYEFQDGKS